LQVENVTASELPLVLFSTVRTVLRQFLENVLFWDQKTLFCTVLGFFGANFFQVFKKHSECPQTYNKHLKYLFYFLVEGG
jgi:hypothetical protein